MDLNKLVLTNHFIYLKKLTMRYNREFKKLFNDPDITKYISVPYPLKTDWIREYITRSMEQFDQGTKYTWGIFKTDINQFVGVGVIKDIDLKNNLAKLGYSVGKEYWHHGFTHMAVKLMLCFAFNHLQLNRIEVRIDLEDDKSITLLEEVMGRQEGIMRQALMYGTEYRDVYLYSILRHDFLSSLV